MKKIYIIFVLLLSCFLFSCKKKTELIKKDVLLTVSSNIFNLFEGDEAFVEVNTENFDGEIIYKSLNTNICTINNGTIKALNEGNTTIKIIAGDKEESITVIVTPKEVVYDLAYIDDSFTIIFGNEYALKNGITRNGNLLDNTFFAFETTGDILSISVDGIITPFKCGEQEINIKGYYNNELIIAKSIKVYVSNFLEIRTNILNNTINLETYEADGRISECSLENVEVFENGKKVLDPLLEYEIIDPSIINIENNVIKAVKEGNTKVKIKYQKDDLFVESNVDVLVTKTTIYSDFSFIVKGNADPKSAFRNTGDVKIDFSNSSIDLKLVKSILSNGSEIKSKVSGAMLTLRNAPEGDNEYVLVTDKYNIVINGIIYSYEINNKDDFYTYMSEYNKVQGYVVLTCDIDLLGMSLNNSTDDWLRSTFNGLGHTISNFKVNQGFIPSFSETGILKNIQLINAIVDCGNENGERFGIIGQEICGTLENVLIDAKLINIENREKNNNRQNILFGCSFAATTLRNVICNIDVQEYSGTLYGFGNEYSSGLATVDNVYIVCNKKVSKISSSATSIDVSASYLSIDELLENESFESFKGWTIEEGLLPYMSEYAK